MTFAPLRAGALAAFALCALVRGAQAEDTIRLGVNGSMTEAPFHIAQQKGYFRDEGLTVQFVSFRSAADMVVPLGAGQLDAGGGAPTAGLYNAVARGIDVRVVADLGSDPPGYGFQELLVRTDLVKAGRYKSVKDLKGMTISCAAQGATGYAALGRLLQTAGLALSDVRLVYLGYPDQVVALKNGSVDASLMPEPNATLAVQTGVATKIMGDDAFYPNEQIAVLLFGRNLLSGNRDAGVRFTRAFLKAVRFYNGALKDGKLAGPNADEVIRIMTAETSIKDPAIFRKLTPNGSNPAGHVNAASMRADLAFFKPPGLIQGEVTADGAIDESFVNDASR